MFDEKEEKPKKVKEVPPPLNEKEWIFYHKDLTTSIMVALSSTQVAVSRAYHSESDRYNYKKGRSIALSRMRELLPRWKQGLPLRHVGEPSNFYWTRYASGKKPGHLIFEVSPPGDLFDEEESFFTTTILPKFSRQDVQAPEVIIARPEEAGEGPVV